MPSADICCGRCILIAKFLLIPDLFHFQNRLPLIIGNLPVNQRLQRLSGVLRKNILLKIAIIHYRELPLIFDFLKAGWQLLYFEQNAAILIHKSLLPKIPPEVKWVDLGPLALQNVKNPQVLLSVFSLYVNLYLQASRVIYDIYKKNVSDYYKPKTEHLQVMESDMRQKNCILPPQGNRYNIRLNDGSIIIHRKLNETQISNEVH